MLGNGNGCEVVAMGINQVKGQLQRLIVVLQNSSKICVREKKCPGEQAPIYKLNFKDRKFCICEIICIISGPFLVQFLKINNFSAGKHVFSQEPLSQFSSSIANKCPFVSLFFHRKRFPSKCQNVLGSRFLSSLFFQDSQRGNPFFI